MTSEQIRHLYWREPFQAFEILLSDQRTVVVKNFDYISLSPDHRVITLYGLGDEVEVIDIALIVSVKFRDPDLLADLP